MTVLGRERQFMPALKSRLSAPQSTRLIHPSAVLTHGKRMVPLFDASSVALNLMDGSPSWNPLPTQFIASHGTRARSSARRLRSNSKTSGHFEFACKCKAACANLLSSTRELTANCEVATLSISRSGTSATAIRWQSTAECLCRTIQPDRSL